MENSIQEMGCYCKLSIRNFCSFSRLFCGYETLPNQDNIQMLDLDTDGVQIYFTRI